jgi:uncharacterized membrane protein
MSETSSSSGGIGVAGALGVAFVVLKLTGVINWSWLWVLAPFWIGWAIFLAILAVVGLIWLIAVAFGAGKPKSSRNSYYRTSQGRTVRRKTRRY